MKYLASLLAVCFLAGCASTSTPKSGSVLGIGGYTDYQATAADGSVKVHRVYKNGSQVWLSPAEAAAK